MYISQCEESENIIRASSFFSESTFGKERLCDSKLSIHRGQITECSLTKNSTLQVMLFAHIVCPIDLDNSSYCDLNLNNGLFRAQGATIEVRHVILQIRLALC